MRRASRFVLALPLVVSLAACSGTAPTSETPGTDTSTFQPTVPEGTTVYVNRGGQWLPAAVVRQTGAASVLVHYDGMPADWDEDVAFDRVRSRPTAAAPAADFKTGEVVRVSNQNRLLLAEVAQQLDAGTFRVHYAGYGPEVVENVPATRIQRPLAAVTAHPVGSAVLVDVGGAAPMPGKVLAAVTDTQWIVRLDGAGPQYDQQVGPDRIRPASAPPPAPTTTAPAATAPATTTTAPAATAPVAPPAPAPLKAGDAVLLHVRSVLYAGKVVGPGAAAGTLRVRVEGQSADEEVLTSQLSRLQDPLKGLKYQVGQLIFIEWHGVYAPGKIIKDAGSGNYKVRVDGKGAEADEVVPFARIRPRS